MRKLLLPRQMKDKLQHKLKLVPSLGILPPIHLKLLCYKNGRRIYIQWEDPAAKERK